MESWVDLVNRAHQMEALRSMNNWDAIYNEGYETGFREGYKRAKREGKCEYEGCLSDANLHAEIRIDSGSQYRIAVCMDHFDNLHELIREHIGKKA